jgi:acetyl esterase/lipase
VVHRLNMSRRASLRLDWLAGNVRELRAKYEHASRVTPRGPHEWLAIDVGGRRIRILLHDAEGRGDRAVFYFHGGGWIVGSPATHADVSSALCAYTGLPVISVDYRLAPEHKAAAAVADGLAVVDRFLSGCVPRLRPQRAILCGDSAGGSIALAVERSAPRGVKESIDGVCSLYGGFGLSASNAIRLFGKRSDGLDAECIRRYWSLANTSRGRGPYSLSALDHGNGCPVYLLVAGRDPLSDDSIALARMLRSRGRPVIVDMHRYEGHGFLQVPHRRQSVRSAFQRISRWIGKL